MDGNVFTGEELLLDLQEGRYSDLYKKISEVHIEDAIINDAFTSFINSVECGSSFSVADIVFRTESLLKEREVSPVCGDDILALGDIAGNKSFRKKLMRCSVAGICGLISLDCGIMIDVDAAGGIGSAEIKRFAVMKPEKAVKLAEIARMQGTSATRVGKVISSEGITLMRGDEQIRFIPRSSFVNSSADETVWIGHDCLPYFRSAFLAVCSYASCGCVSGGNLLRFGTDCTLSEICASALGYYSAMMYLKILPTRLIFTREKLCGVATPRPEIADGDYLFLLKLRADNNGLPDRTHHGQLNYYLTEMRHRGVIKSVLPIKENTANVIARLCGDKFEYVSLSAIPDNCTGVIVSVARGDSVNGVKLGYFKNIE